MFSSYAKSSIAQNILDKKITINVTNVTVQNVIELIKKQTDINFSYSNNFLLSKKLVSYNIKSKTVGNFLTEDLSKNEVDFKVINNQIVLFSGNEIADEKNLSNTKKAIPISGYVYDSDGLPLPGVSISEKGKTNATSTNLDGFFTLNVSDENAVILISSIGFIAKETKVGNQKSFKLTLESSINSLQDVVVIGYGTTKKITSTGAISTITTKELVQSPAANISNSLVGRLPGLFASQAGGEPGNDQSKLRIRGVGTFTGNTDPLVLVDGVENSNFNNIDPNEIESLTILKDASSTAVYGIRGANGVIIITTKQGKLGKPRISYSYNLASNSFTALRAGLNSADYARAFNIARSLDNFVSGSNLGPLYSPEDIAKFESGEDPIFFPNTNWYDVVLKKASSQSQHNVNISGGQEKVKYFISAGLFNQEGLFRDFSFITKDFDPNTTYKRYNFRSNFNFDVSKDLKITVNISSQTENRRSAFSNFTTSRIIGEIGRAAPVTGPGFVGDKIVTPVVGDNNPIAAILGDGGAGGLRRDYRNNLSGLLRFDYKLDAITKGLGTYGQLSHQTFNSQDIINQRTQLIYQAVKSPTGPVFIPNGTETSFAFRQQGTNTRSSFGQFGINYNRSFGKHNVTGLILYDQQKIFDPALAFAIPSGVQSIAGRVTYNFKQKYLAEFNGAYNGTENFIIGKRFGFFPSGSIGWVPTEEAFFPKNDIISFLKIRATYGITGNDDIGGARFLYNPTSYTFTGNNNYYFGNALTNYNGVTGIREGRTGNPSLTWEEKKSSNLGLEAYLFKEKINLTVDLFRETRNNILATPNTFPSLVGFIQPAANLGKMRNEGLEVQLGYTDKAGEFGYRVSGNLSFARNKILFQDEVARTFSYQNRTGQRFGQYYGLLTDGLFNTWDEVNADSRPVYEGNNRIQPGDIRYRDINGDGFINDDDAVPIGYSNIPEITYGISLGTTFKGFDLSILFQGVGNVSLNYTNYQRSPGFGGAPIAGTASYLIESWSPERYAAGLPISFPRWNVTGSPNYKGSDFFTVNASYLRLKNAEIGYTFSNKILGKVGMKNLRIFFNANNLITWSNVYDGIDPENLPSNNTSEEPYPLVRTINGGLTVNF
ncbi:SusC/RagA family TonB-linked outer membrane protein [Pedobacter psychrophilus]|uniref:SusC/RagA family TonB-linked outer membrane protein n=1 Tax=Pedobacter psychrophilus TaxID=1826909 RepID=A0A179DNC4_9SPHI|nr:SusC/RagA family TonB-linked outer membrane protein [Pedobacter psychrophilus]